MAKDKHRYVSVDDVYRTAGITSTVVSRQNVESHVERAEVFACRLTKTIYYKYNLEEESVSSATDDTLTGDGVSWSVNEWKGQYVKLTSGTGSGQIRKILTNTSSSLTLDREWSTNPDSTSTFSIFYVPKTFNPRKDFSGEDCLDGNGRRDYILPFYPLVKVEELVVADVTVTPSSLHIYKNEGRIYLSRESEQQTFINSYPKQLSIVYWYGVDSLPGDVARLTEIKASLQLLQQQMGGTFDVPSTFSLPDLNVSIGQAYINIKGTVDVLQREYDDLITRIKIYPVFA